MKYLVSLFVVFALVISLSAQNKMEVKVPEKVKAAFAKNYSDVKEVKWVKEGKSEFKAEFKKDDKEMAIIYDGKGNLKKTKSEISKSDLPKGVEDFVAKDYKDWTITKTSKIEDAKGDITYEARIVKGKMDKNLMFNKEGKEIGKKEMKEEKMEMKEKEKAK